MWSTETSKAIRKIADQLWSAMGEVGVPPLWVQEMALQEHRKTEMQEMLYG